MSISPGRFSEFMVKGAVTEPDPADSVYNENAGIQQSEPIPVAPELTTPTPSVQSNRQSIPPDPPTIWPIVEGDEPKTVAVSSDTSIQRWDGSKPLSYTLPSSQHIRSLWFMRAPGQQVSIYSGGTTSGAQLTAVPLTGQCAEIVNLPDGNTTVTLVAAGAFSQPIGVMFSANILPIIKDNETAYPDGATPYFASFTGTYTGMPASITGSLGVPALVGQRIYVTQFRLVGIAAAMVTSFDFRINDAGHALQFKYDENVGQDIAQLTFVPPIFGTPTVTAVGDPTYTLTLNPGLSSQNVSGFVAGYIL